MAFASHLRLGVGEDVRYAFVPICRKLCGKPDSVVIETHSGEPERCPISLRKYRRFMTFGEIEAWSVLTLSRGIANLGKSRLTLKRTADGHEVSAGRRKAVPQSKRSIGQSPTPTQDTAIMKRSLGSGIHVCGR